MVWPLLVLNNLGEGLVVATKAGSNTSDLSLIMSPRVTANFEKIKVQRGIFSSANGHKIQGIVKEMLFIPSWYGKKALLAITGHSIIRINPIEYKLAGKNKDLFYYHDANFKPQALARIRQKTFIVEGGVLTAVSFGGSKKIPVPFGGNYVAPSELAISTGAVKMCFYDEVNNNFHYYPVSFFNQTLTKVAADTSGAFNPANLKNKVNIAAGSSESGHFRFLLSDTKTNADTLYILDSGVFGFPNTPPAPIKKIDVSGAPHINQANEVVIADNQKVIYYATDTKIYAIVYGGANVIYDLRYTVSGGERITTLQYYHEVGYPYKNYNPPFIKTNGKQLIMSTYNGSEGKVYLLPITHLGIGTINEANVKVFGGFGKVTAITPQK